MQGRIQEDVTRFDPALEVVWENRQDNSGPRAIVRDRRSGRLYHWPALRAWIGDVPAMWRAAEIQVAVPPTELVPRDIKHRREANQLRLF